MSATPVESFSSRKYRFLEANKELIDALVDMPADELAVVKAKALKLPTHNFEYTNLVFSADTHSNHKGYRCIRCGETCKHYFQRAADPEYTKALAAPCPGAK